MELLSTLFYFIVTIFVLVSVHEFGHFITARMFGIYVPVYSIGMGKRLFGWNKINGFTFNNLPEDIENQLGKNTDYRLSLLPLGGYAKIAGMIDETQREELKGEPQSWEFRSKSWWKKSIVICAGVIFNLILAGLIYTGLKFSQGEEVWDTTTVSYVSQSSLSAKVGVQPGDKITAVSGVPVTNWQALQETVFLDNLGKDFTLTVDRGGSLITFTYPLEEFGNAAEDPETALKNFGLVPEGVQGVRIADAIASRPADRAGFKKGDLITRVGDIPTDNSQALTDNIRANSGKEITIHFTRSGQAMSLPVTPDADGTVGIQLVNEPFSGTVHREEYSIAEAFSLGFTELWTTLNRYTTGIWMIITGKVDAASSLGGPIKIAQYAGRSAEGGAVSFFSFMAFLSISLAFLNILPIPALDGGHLIIILVEAVIRRELSQKVKLRIQQVGVSFLLLLMAFMFLNDIRGLW